MLFALERGFYVPCSGGRVFCVLFVSGGRKIMDELTFFAVEDAICFGRV